MQRPVRRAPMMRLANARVEVKESAMSEVWNRFGPTAAREHSKPGRTVRPSSITIDVHSHVAVPEAASFVKPHLDLMSIPW